MKYAISGAIAGCALAALCAGIVFLIIGIGPWFSKFTTLSQAGMMLALAMALGAASWRLVQPVTSRRPSGDGGTPLTPGASNASTGRPT